MSRINLTIADGDEAYLNSLADFILNNYDQVFEVAIFSQAALLESHLAGLLNPGILLAAPEMASPSWADSSLVQISLVSEPQLLQLGQKQVFKYQAGPKIVQSILKLYGENTAARAPAAVSPRKAKVVAVYSAAGGTGKTSIAVGCSLQSAWEGKSVFYLNLENLPATKLFFAGEEGDGLSALLFYLKQQKSSADLKVQALRRIDPLSQVHYLNPPDSALDLGEDNGDCLAMLIVSLRNSGLYDYVFIDLSCQINTNNLAVLEASDVILLVSTPEPHCRLKDELLAAELRRWSARSKADLLERICPIWNKWEPNLGENESLWEGRRRLYRIPRVSSLLLAKGEHYQLDLNSPFGSALFQIQTAFSD